MTEHLVLRTVMQVSGMYCVVNALFSACEALSRYITWRHFVDLNRPMWESTKGAFIEPLIYALVLLVVALILLAKADWWATRIAKMSRPQKDDVEEEESAESADLTS